MDVSCPRCKTEYEFDDARVPDSGVTVKCTSCNHVFRVRKKSAAPQLHLPPLVKPGDETIPAKSPAAIAAMQGVREWKVRQPSGNIFSFKELTTLQKWIVERKVSRDDEISLTGEAWKRLGNIAELASFFQVVDDAKKVQELEALQQMQDKLSTKPEAYSAAVPPPPPPEESQPPRSASQSGPVPAPGERAGLLQMPIEQTSFPPRGKSLHDVPTQPPDLSDLPPTPKKKLVETMRDPGFAILPPRGPSEPVPEYKPPPLPKPPPPRRRPLMPEVVEEETIRPQSGGGAGKWIGLLLVLAGLGGAAGWYFMVFLPEAARVKELADIDVKAKADADAKIKEEQDAAAAEKAEADRKAAADAERKKKKDQDAVAVVVDAGPAVAAVAAVPKDAGVAVAVASGSADGGEKKEPKRNADYWINQADRMRDKDRPEAALDAYGKALDLSPDNIEALTGKGLCYLDMAKPAQAEPILEQVLKTNPRYAPAIMGLAESYRFQGKKESAVAMYQKYLDTFPNGPEAGVARSNIERLK